jgi:hypothetical protein
MELRQTDDLGGLDIINKDKQDEIILLTMVRPILFGLLCHLKREVIDDDSGVKSKKIYHGNYWHLKDSRH